jgi:hypothetical protein
MPLCAFEKNAVEMSKKCNPLQKEFLATVENLAGQENTNKKLRPIMIIHRRPNSVISITACTYTDAGLPDSIFLNQKKHSGKNGGSCNGRCWYI